jgi:hypothetical protein
LGQFDRKVNRWSKRVPHSLLTWPTFTMHWAPRLLYTGPTFTMHWAPHLLCTGPHIYYLLDPQNHYSLGPQVTIHHRFRSTIRIHQKHQNQQLNNISKNGDDPTVGSSPIINRTIRFSIYLTISKRPNFQNLSTRKLFVSTNWV